MNHYNYKIANVKTGEFYIGVRSCKCPIEEDSYMGSSSIWNKIYIKEHKQDLVKEILETFETRKLANGGEVKRLKKVEGDPKCINQYFDYTPDVTGTKQTPEWIEKRKMFGEKNGMFGKHHTEETKKRISKKLKGRVITEEARKKIGDFHRGKMYGPETRQKISKAHQKLRRIENIQTGEVLIMSLTDFCNLHPECKANDMRRYCSGGWIYHKIYKVTNCEASSSDTSSKLGEIGEHPEMDNPVGSVGNVSCTTNL